MIVLRNAFDKIKSGLKKIEHHLADRFDRLTRAITGKELHKETHHKEKSFSNTKLNLRINLKPYEDKFRSNEEKRDFVDIITNSAVNIIASEEYFTLKEFAKMSVDFFSKKLGISGLTMSNWAKNSFLWKFQSMFPTLLALLPEQDILDNLTETLDECGRCYSEVLYMYGSNSLVFLYDCYGKYWFIQDRTYAEPKERRIGDGKLFEAIAMFFDPEHDNVFKSNLDKLVDSSTRDFVLEYAEFFRKVLITKKVQAPKKTWDSYSWDVKE